MKKSVRNGRTGMARGIGSHPPRDVTAFGIFIVFGTTMALCLLFNPIRIHFRQGTAKTLNASLRLPVQFLRAPPPHEESLVDGFPL